MAPPGAAGAAADVSLLEWLTLWWIGGIEHYLVAVERGLPIALLKLENLTRRPVLAMGHVLDHCELRSTMHSGHCCGFQ